MCFNGGSATDLFDVAPCSNIIDASVHSIFLIESQILC